MSRATGFPPKVRQIVCERAMGCCERCGQPVSVLGAHYHHRRPRGAGGSRRPDTNTASNCALLCPMDHMRIEAARADSLSTGWLVRQNESPSQMPILMHGQWFLLDDEGGKTPVEAVA